VLAVPVASAATPPPPPQHCVQYTPNPGEPFQPLEVCGSLDKASYKSSETITATVTITNLGSAAATDVELFGSTNDFQITTVFAGAPGLTTSDGVDIPAGATVSGSATGFSADPASGLVHFAGGAIQIVDGQEPSTIPQFSVAATVTPVFGNFIGKVVTSQTDADGNPLPTTGLADVTVTVSSEVQGGASVRATTDADGVFTLKNLPGGPYFVDFGAPGGWDITPTIIDIATPHAPNHGRFVAVRPLTESLQATIRFNEPSYAVGDTAHLTITFDNLKNVPLTGIKSDCNLDVGGNRLTGAGPGWAPFNTSEGATVPAGTSTFQVSEVVPQVEPSPGQPASIFVVCAFGTSDQLANHVFTDPTPRATAPVIL
jgi:hypothetical protein